MSGSDFSFQNIPTSLQRLAPEQARFCLAAARFLEKDLALNLRGCRILCALSGGADSSAMLLCLNYLATSKGISLCAAHLDHGLRPSSAQEAEWCRALCDSLRIPFFSCRKDIATLSNSTGTGIEECARTARYAFFNSVARQRDCDWIAVGHNNNDLAEDTLMRLIRGAGWPGLGGMRAVDVDRRLVRPLLMSPRKDIEKFLQAMNFTWLEDESNADVTYFRNRVRTNLLPQLLVENPAFLENISGLWRLARIDEDYFEQQLQDNLTPEADSGKQTHSGTTRFSAMDELKALHKTMRLRLYKQILAGLGPGQVLLESLLRLDAGLVKIMEGKARQNRGQHQFPGGKLAIVTRDGIIWEKSLD